MAEGLDEEKDDRNDAEVVIDDRKADIRAAFDAVAGEEAEEAPEPKPVAPERTERVRDEKGRFQPKEETRQAEPPKGRSRQSAPAELEPVESAAKVAKPE